MATARMTIDTLREQVERMEAEVGMEVLRLEADLGTTVEANTTLSTRLAEASLLRGSQ